MSSHSKIPLNQKIFHALVFAIGLILLSKPAWNPFPELGKALGEALLIALLVIYLVEVSSHQRLENTAEEIIRKIGKNIIPLVYGHELPQPLVESLEANTLLKPIYREDVKLNFELSSVNLKKTENIESVECAPQQTDAAADAPIPPDATIPLCKLACTYTYSLVNCSDMEQKFPLKICLERDKWLAEMFADGSSEPDLIYVKVGEQLYMDQENKDEILTRLSLPLDTKINLLRNHLKHEQDGSQILFEFSDFSIQAKGKVPITFHGVLHKRNSDNEVWSTFYPTLQVQLSITSVDFDVEARFPEEGSMIESNFGTWTNTWTYNAPLLAGQAVLIWWRPKA